jgi:hypothetical protein
MVSLSLRSHPASRPVIHIYEKKQQLLTHKIYYFYAPQGRKMGRAQQYLLFREIYRDAGP